MTEQPIIRKEFPNGDVAVDEGSGLVYRTPDARYTVELVPPPPLSEDPYGVDLVRTTRSEHGLEREQRLTLAEYHSFMSAEEHVREVEAILLEQGREGLPTEMALVEAMPYEPDDAVYMVGLYPFDPDRDHGTLSLIRVDGQQLDVAAVAHGSSADLAPIEQRLWDVQAEGDPGRLLDAAAQEAVRAGEMAPGTPLFAREGVETSDPALPVALDNDLIPTNAQGDYIPHHRDEAGITHFFAVVNQPEDEARELRYFRMGRSEEGDVLHHSLPVMPVSDPTVSPWPLPALELFLEEGDLDAAQALARQTARDHDLPFPDKLPALGPEREPESGWYHYDTALVLATPQGVDDGFSVGAVDVYRNHEREAWAARYLPMGEFDTLDEALNGELLVMRMRSEERLALSPAQFRDEPAIYERIARAEADAALTDLLEQHDGHLPPDYDGDHEPQWEPLTSKEWEAYRDFVQMIRDADPEIAPAYGTLPTATPRFAGEELVAGSEQPPLPYRTPEDFAPEVIALPSDLAPTWRLDIVPARDPEGAPLGYSAVCVMDFSDLAEALSPDSPERAQWLEVAQFQTEERAQRFREDFMAVAGSDELGHITGPALAGVIADDLEMDSRWQIMTQPELEKLKAGEWAVPHETSIWRPCRADTPPEFCTNGIDL